MIDFLVEKVHQAYPRFGPNKRQEVVRLIFEIAKREKISHDAVLADLPDVAGFVEIKDVLVKRRFPSLTQKGIKIKETFRAVDVTPGSEARILSFNPRKIYVERGVEKAELVERFQKKFPDAQMQTIDSYKGFVESQTFSVQDYNKRSQVAFLVKERFDFFKPCPCTPGVVRCGYHNAQLGFGCPFECSYCFLQNYTNAPGMVFPVNLDDFFEAFKSYPQGIRVGSGQLTDSLVFDDVTNFAPHIVDRFREYPDSIFEFKTKSQNIEGLLSVKGASNIAVGFSLNPQEIVEREEKGTASLKERLEAARRCAVHGYRTAFHFDPIFYYENWERAYVQVVENLFDVVPSESMVWISLGTLRMSQRHKKMIENRFPNNTILDEELLTALDGKIRYQDDVRKDIYRVMMNAIRSRSKNVPVYLCMEPQKIWQDLDVKYQWAWKKGDCHG